MMASTAIAQGPQVLTWCPNPALDVRGDDRFWGGGGPNFVRAAIRYPGAVPGTVCLVTFRGTDDDDLEPHVKGLQSTGVELHITTARGKTRTVTYAGNQGFFGQAELDISDAELSEAFDRLAQVHSGQVVVITGSLIPGKMTASDYSRAIKLAHDLGAVVVLDTRPEVVKDIVETAKAEAGGDLEIKRQWLPNFLKVNLEEACALFGHEDPENLSGLRAAAAELLPHTTVLITLGPKGGALVCMAGGVAYRVWIESPNRLPHASNVACGDTFLAWFIMGITNGKGIIRAVMEALGAADANCTTPEPAVFPVKLALEQAGYAIHEEVY